jgi:ATP-dependent protease HslVU (ClpYQ) peptidase subunit
MTAIAAKVEAGKIVMACDSQYSRGWHGKKTGYPEKIVLGSDFAAGVSGNAAVIPMLAAYAKDHGIGSGGDLRIAEWCFEFLGFCKKHTGEWKQEAHLLIAHCSGLYTVHDWLPLQIKDYCAIGSGFEHAEAALYLGKSPAEAVGVAVNMAYGCGGDIVSHEILLSAE